MDISDKTHLSSLSKIVERVLDKADKIVLHGVSVSCETYFEDEVDDYYEFDETIIKKIKVEKIELIKKDE